MLYGSNIDMEDNTWGAWSGKDEQGLSNNVSLWKDSCRPQGIWAEETGADFFTPFYRFRLCFSHVNLLC